MGSASLITRVCCEAARSAILATAWLLVLGKVHDVITSFKFGDDRFRGFASAEGQILPFPIDFDGRPYNTLTLPCERVIIFSRPY